MSKSHVVAAPEPAVVNETNLSRGWAKLLVAIIDGSGSKLSPFVLSLTGFDETGKVAEIPSVRQSLDQLMKTMGKLDVEGVAWTIFPQRLWEMSKGDRARLFFLYRKTFPRYVAMNRRANRRGLYFERLIMFNTASPCGGNQLEWILSQYESRTGIRSSMFQATTFDPSRDHVADARLGFPCLQHVSFVPTSAGLIVNAFYATQYVLDKAYGNYLGLAQLGAFMANQMKIPLARLNVTVGVANFDSPKTSAALAPLLSAARVAIATPVVSALHEPALAVAGV